MGQDWFVYSFVARGTTVVTEYSEFTGNFQEIAAQCLSRLPSTNNKFTYNNDHHTYNFLIQNGYAYCIVAKESVNTVLSTEYLERIRTEFTRRYKNGKADTATSKSLGKDFGRIMKEQMQYIVDHADEIDKLQKVKAQVSEVKGIMIQNIDATITRGQNIDSLSEKAENLRDSAQEFKKRGTELKRKMWYENMKAKLIVIVILIILALIIWLSICGGFNCAN